MAQEASEPRRTEKETREREELLRFTFDSAPVGIYIADVEERHLKVNVAYQRMVGYSEEELRDKSIFSMTHPDDLARNQVFTSVASSRSCKSRAAPGQPPASFARRLAARAAWPYMPGPIGTGP